MKYIIEPALKWTWRIIAFLIGGALFYFAKGIFFLWDFEGSDEPFSEDEKFFLSSETGNSAYTLKTLYKTPLDYLLSNKIVAKREIF